jgi:hypothetical protein
MKNVFQAAFKARTERDWQEDAGHENGNYSCHCIGCGRDFTGHKRRVLCRVCADIEGAVDKHTV